MPKLKQIKASHRFTKLAGPDLLSRLAAVGKGLLGNPAYPNPPVEPAALKAAGEKYSAAIADALDGGKKAITERNKQRESVIQMLLLLARYVETNCKNDMGTFLSSGFEAASTTRTPPQPLTQPKIRKIAHSGTGELLVSVTPIKNAYSYEVRYAAQAGGATPPAWMTTGFTNAKSATPVNNLTPGTIYTFQVRALGPVGYTAWSDAITRMCT